MSLNVTSIRLFKPDIFSFSECLHFLDRGYDDCLYRVEANRVIKPLFLDDEQILFEVRDDDDALAINILSGEVSHDKTQKITEYIAEWFGLKHDLQTFYGLLQNHDQLAWMTDRFFGLRLMGIPNLFEALCWCVIGQQINLPFAYKLKRRLVETYGTFITYDAQHYYFFPLPEVLADLKTDDLKKLQFSRRKAEYIIGIANDFAGGTLSKDQLTDSEGRRDSNELVNELIKIRGVGQWTANYVLMKSLGRTDCITYGDTGLQSAVSSILDVNRKPTSEEIDTFFRPFAGWESYLVIYLWRTLS